MVDSASGTPISGRDVIEKVLDSGVGFLNAVSADVDSFDSQVAVDVGVPALPFGSDYRAIKDPNPTSYIHQNLYNTFGNTTWTNTDEVFINTPSGQEEVGSVDEADGSLVYASPTMNGEWLTFHDTGGGDGTYHVNMWASSADWGSSTNTIASMSNVDLPRIYGVFSFADGSNNPIWLFSEYSETTQRIIRADPAAQTFTTVYDAAAQGDGIRHWHSIDEDIYNPGTFYATAGDAADEQLWAKSTDNGQTWTTIPETRTPSDRVFPTLNLAFTEDYIWWGSDYHVDGTTHVYRAPRNDLSAYESMFKMSSTGYCYGATRFFSPKGLLLGHKNIDSDTGIFEIFWYDLETNTGRLVFTGELLNVGDTAGVDQMPKYPDMTTPNSTAYIRMLDAKMFGSTKTNTLSVSVSKL